MKNMKKLFLSINLVIMCLSATGQSSHLGYTVGLKIGTGIFDEMYVEGVDLNLTSSRFIYSAAYNSNLELDILTPTPREY
jgi:hypothetical protein